MIYNDFNGKKLSALGMGNMRLPVIDGQDNKINVELSKKMIVYCMEHGIKDPFPPDAEQPKRRKAR